MRSTWWVGVRALLLACHEADRGVSVSQIGDTIVVTNRTPAFRDTAVLVLQTRIGALYGTEEEQLGEIRAIAVDGMGDVYLADPHVGIKHFSADGHFTEWVARSGEGPDEVGCAHAIAAQASRVAIHDPCNTKIAVLHHGSETFIARRTKGGFRYGEDALYYDSAGTLWLGLNPNPPRNGSMSFPRPVAARVAPDGSLVDTVCAPARYATRYPIMSEWKYRAGFWDDKREPWYPKVKWASGPNGRVAYGCPRSFSLDVVRPAGGVLRIEKPWRPVETTADEREFVERWWPPMPSLPKLRPAYARIILTPDGRTWVWPEQPEEQTPFDEQARQVIGREYSWQTAEHGAFEVFDTDGRWLGAVRVPESVAYSGYPTTPSLLIRGDTVWAVMCDSLDVRYVGRFRVVWPSR